MHPLLRNVYARLENERKLFESPGCCDELTKGLQQKDSIYVYFPNRRKYGLATGNIVMDYCIHCGTKMPDSLSDKWFFILRAKYKLTGSGDLDGRSNKIPPEFLTDEWWKKRNIPSRLSYLSSDERDNNRRRKKRDGCFCLDDGKQFQHIFLIYNTRFREYGIKTMKVGYPYIPMQYCLSCGRQLEPSLRDLWAKLLQKYHGIENPFKNRIQFLPKSFRTDLWWKRRAL